MNLFKTLPVLSDSEREAAKDHLFAAVHFWCALSEKGRKEGILALEYPLLDNDEHKIRLPDGTNPFPLVSAADDGFADSESWLFSRLLRIICDGTDYDLWRIIMHYSLCNLEKHVPPATHLSLLIGTQAIRNIHAGEPILYTKYQLSAMLGHELCEEFLATDFPPLALEKPYVPKNRRAHEPTEEEIAAEIELAESLFGQMDCETKSAKNEDNEDKSDEAEEESPLAFADIVFANDLGVQRLLREVERHDIVTALHGADEAVREKVFRNVSKRVAASLKESLAATRSPKQADILQAQKRIIGQMRLWRDCGELVIARPDD